MCLLHTQLYDASSSKRTSTESRITYVAQQRLRPRPKLSVSRLAARPALMSNSRSSLLCTGCRPVPWAATYPAQPFFRFARKKNYRRIYNDGSESALSSPQPTAEQGIEHSTYNNLGGTRIYLYFANRKRTYLIQGTLAEQIQSNGRRDEAASKWRKRVNTSRRQQAIKIQFR